VRFGGRGQGSGSRESGNTKGNHEKHVKKGSFVKRIRVQPLRQDQGHPASGGMRGGILVNERDEVNFRKEGWRLISVISPK